MCCLPDGQTTAGSPHDSVRRVTQFCVRIHHAGYSYAQLLHLWRTAERVGYDGVSLYDVLARPALEVWTTLAVLTLSVRRLVAIPLVLDVGHRHPAMLAKMAATLDQLSGGNRLIVGLGYGGNPDDHRAYGFDWPVRVADRVARLEEHVQVMRALWRAPKADFAGQRYALANADGFATATPGGPPVLIASRGVRHGLGGVARQADLCNISFDLSPAEWQRYQGVIAERCAAAGRDPTEVGLTHNATVVLGASRTEAEQELDRVARSRKLTREQARHGLANALVGTPDEIVQKLLDYRSAGVPLEWVFLLFADLPATRSMRLFATEVLPAYRAAVGSG
jgi:alkanesulfonate monooxygenase SsuD/methylene tetrahydromethanopterin reductase-like flavin-dependent oxidoreductase (luciferase family)